MVQFVFGDVAEHEVACCFAIFRLIAVSIYSNIFYLSIKGCCLFLTTNVSLRYNANFNRIYLGVVIKNS